MNAQSKRLKLDWKTIAVIAIVLGVSGYQWYTGNSLTDSNERPDAGQLATESGNGLEGEAKNANQSPMGSARKSVDAAPAEAFLKSAGGKNLKSPAGLIYTAGRSEHRADHVLKHAADIPDRAGSHGVFNAQGDDVFRLLDQAYELVKAKSDRVKSKPSDDGRTEYIIDMQREIGFKGGQEGNQQNHPKLYKIKLVLADDRVITAFPY